MSAKLALVPDMAPIAAASAVPTPSRRLFDRPVVGIVTTNGIGYAEAVLEAYAGDVIAVPMRGHDDAERIAATGARRIVEPAPTTGWATPRYRPRHDPRAAQITYSSGTTGTPRGIILTHANLASTTERLIAAMALDDGIREYVGVPLTYSFGMGRVRAIAAVGGQVFVPPHGFDPSEIARLLARGEINALSAVPTLWRVLLDNADLLGAHGGAVRWIEIGSQAMARAEKEALKRLFPNARIVQHYGLTEASRTTFLKIHEAAGDDLDSVGTAISPVDLRIAGEGQIMVRGPHVARAQLLDGRVEVLTDDDGWLATGDLGELRGGMLHFRGRGDDQINCGGVSINPDALESAIAEELAASGVPETRAFAVARVADVLRGDGVLVAVEQDSGLTVATLQAAALRAAQRFGLHAASALHVVAVERLPRTPTGKVRRGALAAAFAAPEGSSAANSPAAPLEARLVQLWRTTLGTETVSARDNFFDLGGEPLLGHALIEGMVAAGIGAEAARRLWDGLSIAEIAALDAAPAGDTGTRRDAVEARILALWREVLGRDDIGAHESFYDVGGDSLSAIGLALNMERAGFDHDLARSILDGRTIAEIADMAAAATPPDADAPVAAAAPPRAKSQVALLNEGLNFIKGILIFAIVMSHWLPLYFKHWGIERGPVAQGLQPLLSMGTPTLVFIFGMGVAVFHSRQYQGSRAAFRSSVRQGAGMLAVGLLVGVILEVAAAHTGRIDLPVVLRAITDGPFSYFLLATLSLPLWIGGLRRDMATVQRMFGAGLAMYAAYLVVGLILPAHPASAIMMELKHLLIGHWSLFQLGSFSLFGVGTGVLIEMHLRRDDKPGTLAHFAPFGVLMIWAGLILSVAANDVGTWFTPHKSITLWSAVLYAGVALALVGHFEALSAWASRRRAARVAIQVVASIGVLLFPIYVLQSIVYHGTEAIVKRSDLSFIHVLSAMIAAILAVASYLVWRVYRLYYADRR